jgi:hypothetical protein
MEHSGEVERRGEYGGGERKIQTKKNNRKLGKKYSGGVRLK